MISKLTAGCLVYFIYLEIWTFMSVPSCFTCHNNISLRCSFSFLIRHLSWYEVAVTSVEKPGCLQCALQSDSFTEINKYPERKGDFKPVVYFVKAARSKREKSNHTFNQTKLWRLPSCHGTVCVCVFFKTYIVMYSFTATTSSTELWTYEHWFSFFFFF